MNYGQFCPIAKATEILGERWTILILRELAMGGRRFSELQRGLGDISPALLAARLKSQATIATSSDTARRRLRSCGRIMVGRPEPKIIASANHWSIMSPTGTGTSVRSRKRAAATNVSGTSAGPHSLTIAS